MVQTIRGHSSTIPLSDVDSDIEYEQRRADRYNAKIGHLNEIDGIDCPICRNKGDIEYVNANGNIACYMCECMERRSAKRQIMSSGMEQILERCTFETYVTNEQWQKLALSTAQRYADNPAGWFIACGQVGSGKTHLCAAICGKLLTNGYNVRFMPWREESARLKAMVNAPDYAHQLAPIKTAAVLYIDDMFKTQSDANVTTGDVNLAFEIINYRYNNALPTIISTEKTRRELMAIDEGTGSRIIEMCGSNVIEIARSAEKNVRIHVTAKKIAKENKNDG